MKKARISLAHFKQLAELTEKSFKLGFMVSIFRIFKQPTSSIYVHLDQEQIHK